MLFYTLTQYNIKIVLSTWVILVKIAQEGFLDGFGIFWKKAKFFFQFFYSKVLY